MERRAVEAIADEILAAWDAGRQVAPFSARGPAFAGFDLAAAYAAADLVRARRFARGEAMVGRKIGFTNRTIWPEYGVWAPIWGAMYDDTVRQLGGAAGTQSLDRCIEPRFEPEIAFGIARPLQPGMDERALLGCIDWVAHGAEIVQSIFPGWKFAAADTAAAFALHGAYAVGPRQPVAPRFEAWLVELSGFEIELLCDGAVVATGHARDVLDGPLSALKHLVAELAERGQPPVAAGEIVTTGTLTRAIPCARGQRWQTRLRGTTLPALDLRLV